MCISASFSEITSLNAFVRNVGKRMVFALSAGVVEMQAFAFRCVQRCVGLLNL